MRVLWAALLAVSLGGCTPGLVVGMTSKYRSNTTNDTFVLPKRPRDFVSLVTESAGALKYDVAGVDRASNVVRLSSNSNQLASAFLGPFRQINIEAKLRPDGRTVEVQLTAVGNLSSAKQDTVDKRLKELRDTLIAKAS